jgi:ABC-type glycerol-3-phosphate transport system substrate-binding protein
VLFYNLTWAKELGFNTPPATPDDFRLQACAAAKAVTADGNPDDAGTGGWITATDANTLLSWMYAYGGVDLPVRISQPYHFDTPNNQKALAFFNSLFADGCAWNSRQPTPYDYFAKRQALMVSGDLQDVAVQARMQAHDSSKDEWTVIPYPSLSQKQPVLVSGLSFGIMRHGDTPDLAAWLLARWLNQPENQARLSQASGLLPANKATFNNLTDYENTYPQWKEAELWTDVYQPAPGIGSWQAAHLVLADMGWQVFHPRTPPDSPSTLLSELDQSINDVLIHKP